MRIGQGYDIHKLVEGRPLILGGVKVPFEKGLLGHSDADVLIHAIIDSLFGAANLGDIGEHFPDTSLEFKGADSIKLLEWTGKIINRAGYKIVNIDSTLICQKPKLLTFKEDMKKNIASALRLDSASVSVKAKTKEGMDASGKGEAIEAYSVALIEESV